MFFNRRANFRSYLLPLANRSLFRSGSNEKLIFVLRVFALRAVLEERIKLVNRGITVFGLTKKIILADGTNTKLIYLLDNFSYWLSLQFLNKELYYLCSLPNIIRLIYRDNGMGETCRTNCEDEKCTQRFSRKT
jgi:hypothetical protein